MASAYPPSSASSALPHRGAASKASNPPASNAPQGTFLPGTKVQVGSQRVTIEKYLSEGGFAHVYVVRIPREGHKHELAVLKRVAVPDREHLANMRTEVETMKKLNGHRHVVAYMDSHASQLKGGGYEVFLLMEFCSGGGLIDFMNTRLQHRLTEPEILKIFGDVAEGVACMHYLKPPLLHRDLKVENVLISKSGSSGTPTYKICDFGSAARPRPAAKTAEEGRLIEEDVQKHTTMQYRSPEMIDVWRKQPIDEKADIWALGVFLYKLCYYTTPFEDVGQMAILNASYKYPSYPSFSDRLKKFIGTMLKEDPRNRPNIYQVIKEVSNMRGTEVPIKDIYAQRTQSEARKNQSLPAPDPPMSIGLQKQAPSVQTQSIPDIAPMRRGRPTAPAQQTPVAAAKPGPSPARGDPFAALDSKNYDVRAGAVDELSKRFPSLDEFSITQDKGGNFAFSQQSSSTSKENPPSNLNERMTNALADQVFGQSKPRESEAPQPQPTSKPPPSKTQPTTLSSVKAKAREMQQNSSIAQQPTPGTSSIMYKSTGTGPSPPSSSTKSKFPEVSNRPIWKVPDQNRSSSQPRASETAQAVAASLQPSAPPTHRKALLDIHRSKSQTAILTAAHSAEHSSTSSRPSLEGHRPSQTDLSSASDLSRTRSAHAKPRPSSVYVNSNLDYLRDQETSRKRPSMEGRRQSRQTSQDRDANAEERNIDDDMAYLRSNEDDDRRRDHNRWSQSHKKRGSLHSLTDGAKTIFGGRFGDAFKRFEGSSGTAPSAEDSASPEMQQIDDYGESRLLSPIDGSEATLSKASQSDVDSDVVEDTEYIPPDMRREMERRRLSQEEKRVAAAAADYRAKMAEQGGSGSANGPVPTRASTIQKRVQSLLDEGRQSPVPNKRTAEGYGHYTDAVENDQLDATSASSPSKANAPPVARKPTASADLINNPYPKTRPTQQQQFSEPPARTSSLPPQQASTASTQPPTSAPQPRVVSRPSVPPKSQALRTGGNKSQWPPPSDTQKPPPSKPTGGLAALLAKDLEGVPDYPPPGSSSATGTNQAASPASATDDLMDVRGNADPPAPEDVEADFSKRYPSLSGIEMVETEIRGRGGDRGRRQDMREV